MWGCKVVFAFSVTPSPHHTLLKSTQPHNSLLPLAFSIKWIGPWTVQTGHCNLVMEGACACSLLTQPAEPAVKCKNKKFPAVPAYSLQLLPTLIYSFTAIFTIFLLSWYNWSFKTSVVWLRSSVVKFYSVCVRVYMYIQHVYVWYLHIHQ